MYDQNTTLGTFLDAAAARQPTPGGGSVAALVGALAAAMGEMTVNYSVGKKGLEAHQAELRSGLSELTRARRLLLQLMAEDQEAYAALTDARKLPQDHPQRQQTFDVALLACIRVPQAMGATCVAVLDLCDRLAEKVNQHLLSDLAVCADLSMAAIRCSIYNVRVNLNDVTDEAERKRFESASYDLLTRAVVLIGQASTKIWTRHELAT